MSENNMVDARGLSCPEPVMLTNEALSKYGRGAFSVAVTSPAARDNVARTLSGAGRKYGISESGDGWLLTIDAE